MTLSCMCGDFDPSNYAWYWHEHSEVLVMPHFHYRKRCASCSELINPGEEVFKFWRFRVPRTFIEEAIHGDEVPLAPYYTCEICSGLISAVEDLGMCYSITEPLKEQIAEYRAAEREWKAHLRDNPEDDNLTVDDFM